MHPEPGRINSNVKDGPGTDIAIGWSWSGFRASSFLQVGRRATWEYAARQLARLGAWTDEYRDAVAAVYLDGSITSTHHLRSGAFCEGLDACRVAARDAMA
jgi:hypothetical protein